jgi:predicted hydrocarbon binding protein
MGVERENELDELIDKVWMGFFDKLKKNKVPRVRSELGDEVDLFVPQIRALFLMHSNPRFPHIIYTSSYRVARRNAYTIMRKLLPPDFFWKFEFWTNERAFEKLSKVTNRIFRAIMKLNKEGLLSVENVSTDPPEIKILLKLEECAECFGVEANHPLCYHHAGTLAGIVSSLLKEELNGYETECCATGGDNCEFFLEKNGEELKNYLNPEKIDFSLQKRLENMVERKIRPSLGNETALRYYQLVILNSLITNPEMFSASSYEVGLEYGNRLASFLQTYYNKREEELFDMISHYYRLLKHLQLVKKGADKIRADEVAEISGLSKNKLFLGFLFGELEGLFSVIRKEKVICETKEFKNDDVEITFKKQE